MKRWDLGNSETVECIQNFDHWFAWWGKKSLMTSIWAGYMLIILHEC